MPRSTSRDGKRVFANTAPSYGAHPRLYDDLRGIELSRCIGCGGDVGGVAAGFLDDCAIEVDAADVDG
jgi:hypothetical protein